MGAFQSSQGVWHYLWVVGITRSIIHMIKGLKSFTIKNWIIDINSLLRASILYAAETYYNISERNLRMLEGIEEDCLRKIFETETGCPISLLYLQTGHISAQFQIQIMILNFLKIHTQSEERVIEIHILQSSEKNAYKRWVDI